MAWRYTFDGGEEKPLEAPSLYQVAAMTAFAQEKIEHIPQLSAGRNFRSSYGGHVLKLWDDKLVDQYPAMHYGLAWDEFGCLKITMLIVEN